jgi:hypothetical protein
MSILIEPASPRPDVIDAAIDAYVRWREECIGARDAYRRWSSAEKADRMLASCAYVAALDREEIAASVYADAMRHLADECVDDPLLEPRHVLPGYVCDEGGTDEKRGE